MMRWKPEKSRALEIERMMKFLLQRGCSQVLVML
jgi:hypothetical protein